MMSRLTTQIAENLPPMARVLLGIATSDDIEICRHQEHTGSVEDWRRIIELVNKYASPDDPLKIKMPKCIAILLMANQQRHIEPRIKQPKQRDEGERRIGCPRELTPEIMILLNGRKEPLGRC